jgi:hypothetical protein
LVCLQQSCSFETIIKILNLSIKNKCACMRVPGRDDAASSRPRLRSATHACTVPLLRLPVTTKDSRSDREHREPGILIAVASSIYTIKERRNCKILVTWKLLTNLRSPPSDVFWFFI